jgi:hypothetical protein
MTEESVLVSKQAQDIFLFSAVSRLAYQTGILSSESERRERAADHSPPPSAEVKYE